MIATIAAWFLRVWAVVVAAIFAIVMITTGSSWTSSDQWAAPLLFPFLVAAAVFAFTLLDRGHPEASVAPTAVSWCVMLVGAFAVVSFEPLVVALLATAAPAAFMPRRRGPGAARRPAGEAGRRPLAPRS